MIYNEYKKQASVNEVGFYYKKRYTTLIPIILPSIILLLFGSAILAWSLIDYYNDLNSGFFQPTFPYPGVIGGGCLILTSLIFIIFFLIPQLIIRLPMFSETRIAYSDNKLLLIPHGLHYIELNPYYIKNTDLKNKEHYGILYLFYDDGIKTKKYRIKINEYINTFNNLNSNDGLGNVRNNIMNNRDMK